MRTTIIIICFVVTFSVFGQSTKDWTRMDHLNNRLFEPEKDIYGVCFIVPSKLFSFYEKPLTVRDSDNKEVVRFEFNGTLITTFDSKSYKQCDQNNPFVPWLFGCNPDYFNLALECVDTVGANYKVRITGNRLAMISKRDTNFKKQEIKDFVKEWTSLGLDFDRAKNPMHENPSSDSKTINHPDENRYKVWTGESIDIDGDWIKIKSIKGETGWIKWRDKKKILIRMYFAC